MQEGDGFETNFDNFTDPQPVIDVTDGHQKIQLSTSSNNCSLIYPKHIHSLQNNNNDNNSSSSSHSKQNINKIIKVTGGWFWFGLSQRKIIVIVAASKPLK